MDRNDVGSEPQVKIMSGIKATPLTCDKQAPAAKLQQEEATDEARFYGREVPRQVNQPLHQGERIRN
jgi:hypothetical protein